MIKILGLGPGHKDYIVPKVIKILEESEIIIGFERALESLKILDNIDFSKFKKVVSLKEILNIISENKEKSISVIASGDPTFYGITNYIKKNYNESFEIIPGISSFQYLTCKLNKPWGNAFVGSMHGREENFEKIVKENSLSIWLTDKKNTPNTLSKKLLDANINCTVYVGENLSYEDEKITKGSPLEILEKDYENLVVMIVER